MQLWLLWGQPGRLRAAGLCRGRWGQTLVGDDAGGGSARTPPCPRGGWGAQKTRAHPRQPSRSAACGGMKPGSGAGIAAGGGSRWAAAALTRRSSAGRARGETGLMLQPPPARAAPQPLRRGGHKLEDSLDLAGSVSGVLAAESLRVAAESCGRAGGPACSEPADGGWAGAPREGA